MMTGREGEGGEGGEYSGECLFDDNHDNNKYNDNDEYNGTEDGKESRRVADDGGESDYNGRDVIHRPSFGSRGHRTSIVGPHAAAAVINNNDHNNRRHGGGASCPPLPVRPVPPMPPIFLTFGNLISGFISLVLS